MSRTSQTLVRAVQTSCLILFCAIAYAEDQSVGRRHDSTDSFDPSQLCMRAEDEIWLISSRCIPTCGPVDLNRLDCYRWCGESFSPDNYETLSAEHKAQTIKRTVFFLHGNRTDFEWAAMRGLQVFNNVFGTDLNRQPVRYVIWSWPADPQRRRGKEYKQNSLRSVWEANALAEFIGELGNATPIGLVGYSFGAQTTLLAAEQACSREVSDGTGQFKFRICCLAPALQKPWSQVADPFAACEGCVTHSLQMTNSQDRALQAHKFISRFASGSYASWTNVDEKSSSMNPQVNLDIGDLVGSRHNVVLYVSQPFVAAQIRATIFDDCVHVEGPQTLCSRE